MLSEPSAAIVSQTLPVVSANGEAITGTFYRRMFDAHPELRNLFNRGNQANGRQRQALAAAVAAYAAHLTGATDQPFGPVLDRIAHKHASLGIAPAQYPIVGRHLMAAVGEVLGDAATPEIAAAWEEVYWLFACELVAREARLYHANGVAAPAAVWRPWQVVARTEEATDVVSFTLAPADGGPTPAFTPGQYVSVAVDLPDDGGRQIRQYTLSGPPAANTWRIMVKRLRATDQAPAGQVSTVLHDRVHESDLLWLSPPFGDVHSVPTEESPLLLISAGIGATPAMAALEHLTHHAADRPVTLVHADRGHHAHPWRHHLPRYAERLPRLRVDLWYEQDGDRGELPAGEVNVHPGRVDPGRIPVTDDTYVHLCGPLPFMAQVRSGLLARGVPAERIAYEVFGPEMLSA